MEDMFFYRDGLPVYLFGSFQCVSVTFPQGEATIQYNKLQADPKQGKSLDIVLKKVKHRLVENMSSGTADALGLSRAILCNDGLVKRLEELEKTAELYKGDKAFPSVN
uniref:PRKCA-binding protein-like n=1 Tax=Monopterus albus TaxID=43700 RepID=UPI0009B370FF|nr:PRKCA-binding protein-like [Monopterus albus]